MSRIRYIKPGFFKNELLAECDPLARILFAGLWTEADRDGRLEDRPKRLKAALLPYDDCDPDALLEQLHQRGFIKRYVVDETCYIAMPTWYAHQRPHKDEHSRGLPAPPKRVAKSADLQASREIVRTSSEKVGTEVYGELLTGNGEPLTENGLKPLSPRGDDTKKSAPDDGFDKFWNRYPKKAGKKDAHVRWRKMDAGQRERAYYVAEAIAFAVANGYRELEFVPMGSTFLNSERYEDWYDEKGEMIVPGDYSPGGNGKGRKKQADIDASIVRAMNAIDWPEEA